MVSQINLASHMSAGLMSAAAFQAGIGPTSDPGFISSGIQPLERLLLPGVRCNDLRFAPSREALAVAADHIGDGPSSLSGPPHVSKSGGVPPEIIRVLPRGGVIVKTSAGWIQFGVPMWTNKDARHLFIVQNGESLPPEKIPHIIPTTYIFDLDYVPKTDGLLPADAIQYMHFMTKNTTFNMVAPDPVVAKRLKEYLDLSYLGPRDSRLNERIRQEYSSHAIGIPDMEAEISRGFPYTDPNMMRRVMSFEQSGTVHIGDVVVRKIASQLYEIFDSGSSLGTINIADYPIPSDNPFKPIPVEANVLQHVLEKVFIEGRAGVWPIGTGHIFSLDEETSGFIICNGGRYVIVDPPSGTPDFFTQNSILKKAVDGIIITHGHSDHFGNAVPQLMEMFKGQDVKLYTTPVIRRMLRRQYELAIGNHNGGLDQWQFAPMLPHQYTEILGLHFWTDYTFHTVPTIGFDIYERLNMRSRRMLLSFTGDTYADHRDIWRHTNSGPNNEDPVMTHMRAQQIIRHVTQLLHMERHSRAVMLADAGVAPLHTAPEAMAQLLLEAGIQGIDISRVRTYHISHNEALAAGLNNKWESGVAGFIDLLGYFPIH